MLVWKDGNKQKEGENGTFLKRDSKEVTMTSRDRSALVGDRKSVSKEVWISLFGSDKRTPRTKAAQWHLL